MLVPTLVALVAGRVQDVGSEGYLVYLVADSQAWKLDESRIFYDKLGSAHANISQPAARQPKGHVPYRLQELATCGGVQFSWLRVTFSQLECLLLH